MKHILKSLLITTVLTVPSAFGAGLPQMGGDTNKATSSSVSIVDIVGKAGKHERDGDLIAAVQGYVDYAKKQANVLWFHVLFSVENIERLKFFDLAINLFEWSKAQSNTQYFSRKAESEITRLRRAKDEHDALAEELYRSEKEDELKEDKPVVLPATNQQAPSLSTVQVSLIDYFKSVDRATTSQEAIVQRVCEILGQQECQFDDYVTALDHLFPEGNHIIEEIQRALAREIFDKVKRFNSMRPDTANFLAIISLDIQDYESAKYFLSQFIGVQGATLDILYELGKTWIHYIDANREISDLDKNAARAAAVANYVKVISESDEATLVFGATRQLSSIESLELSDAQKKQLKVTLSSLISSNSQGMSLSADELSKNIETILHLYSIIGSSIDETPEFKSFVQTVDQVVLWAAVKNVFEWRYDGQLGGQEQYVKLIQSIIETRECTPWDYAQALQILIPYPVLKGYQWLDSQVDLAKEILNRCSLFKDFSAEEARCFANVAFDLNEAELQKLFLAQSIIKLDASGEIADTIRILSDFETLELDGEFRKQLLDKMASLIAFNNIDAFFEGVEFDKKFETLFALDRLFKLLGDSVSRVRVQIHLLSMANLDIGNLTFFKKRINQLAEIGFNDDLLRRMDLDEIREMQRVLGNVYEYLTKLSKQKERVQNQLLGALEGLQGWVSKDEKDKIVSLMQPLNDVDLNIPDDCATVFNSTVEYLKFVQANYEQFIELSEYNVPILDSMINGVIVLVAEASTEIPDVTVEIDQLKTMLGQLNTLVQKAERYLAPIEQPETYLEKTQGIVAALKLTQLTDEVIPRLQELAESFARMGRLFGKSEPINILGAFNRSSDVVTLDNMKGVLGGVCQAILKPNADPFSDRALLAKVCCAAVDVLIVLGQDVGGSEFALTPVESDAPLLNMADASKVDETITQLMDRFTQMAETVTIMRNEWGVWAKSSALMDDIRTTLHNSETSITDKQTIVRRLNSAIYDVSKYLLAELDPAGLPKQGLALYVSIVEQLVSGEKIVVTKTMWLNAYEAILQQISKLRESIVHSSVVGSVEGIVKTLESNKPTQSAVTANLVDVLTKLKAAASKYPMTLNMIDGALQSLENVTAKSSDADVNTIVEGVVKCLNGLINKTFLAEFIIEIDSTLLMVRAWRETSAIVAEFSDSLKLESIPFDSTLDAKLQTLNSSEAAKIFYEEFLPKQQAEIARLDEIAKKVKQFGDVFHEDHGQAADLLLRVHRERVAADERGGKKIAREKRIVTLGSAISDDDPRLSDPNITVVQKTWSDPVDDSNFKYEFAAVDVPHSELEGERGRTRTAWLIIPNNIPKEANFVLQTIMKDGVRYKQWVAVWWEKP